MNRFDVHAFGLGALIALIVLLVAVVCLFIPEQPTRVVGLVLVIGLALARLVP